MWGAKNAGVRLSRLCISLPVQVAACTWDLAREGRNENIFPCYGHFVNEGTLLRVWWGKDLQLPFMKQHSEQERFLLVSGCCGSWLKGNLRKLSWQNWYLQDGNWMGCYFCLLVENRLNLKCIVVSMISLQASALMFWQQITQSVVSV